MKENYVKFDTSEDLANTVYDALRIAKQTGSVKKGTDEAAEAIERGTSKLIVIAEDVEPPEVVAHLPILCEEQGAAYAFVPSKQELGQSLGIDITSAAAAILDAGDAQHIVDQVVATIAKIKGGKINQKTINQLQKSDRTKTSFANVSLGNKLWSHHCGRCDYQWASRTESPKTCANEKCRSPYWNKKRVRTITKPTSVQSVNTNFDLEEPVLTNRHLVAYRRKGLNYYQIKKNILRARKLVIKGTNTAGSGHPGGSFSMAEILGTLFSNHLKFDPTNPQLEDPGSFSFI